MKIGNWNPKEKKELNYEKSWLLYSIGSIGIAGHWFDCLVRENKRNDD